MPNSTILNLNSLSDPSDNDRIEIVDVSVSVASEKNKKIKLSILKAFFNSGGATSSAFEDWDGGDTYDSDDGVQYVFFQGSIYQYIKSGTSLNESPDENPSVWELKTANDFIDTITKFSGTATGTDTYALTDGGATAYTDLSLYYVEFTNSNTGGCTLNHNSIGAKSIVDQSGGGLDGGEIKSGSVHMLMYEEDNDVFQIMTILNVNDSDKLELSLIGIYLNMI